MLPDELEWVLEMLGFSWPTADEDALVRCAEVWERFAEDATRLHADANRSTATVVAHNRGASINAFQAAYDPFDGDDGHLRNAARTATLIGTALRAAAVVVETGKVAVIAQLVTLAVELISAQAAAPFTLGLSELGSAGATTATRIIVHRLLQELRQALVEAIIACLKEPAVSAVEAMVSDLVRQTVNVGFTTQKGYDPGATARAGAKGARTAVEQTPQTFLEGLRDSMGKQAGGAARAGLDGYLDAASPFRDGEAATAPGAGAGTDEDGALLDSGAKVDVVSLSADGPGPEPGTDLDAGGTPDGDALPLPGTAPGPGSPSDPDGGGDYPLPAPRGDGPSLPDFDGPSPDAPDGGGGAQGGPPSPAPHSAPVHATPPPAPQHGGGSLRTEIDSLATDAPTSHATTHAPHPSEPSAAPPREDLGGPQRTPGSGPGPVGHPGAGTLPGTPAAGPPPSAGRAVGPTHPDPASPATPPAGSTGPASTPRTSPPSAAPAGAQHSAPAGDGRPSSAAQQRTPVAPGPGAAPPHGGPPRTPGASGSAPEQPGAGASRNDPDTHEPGTRQTGQPSSASRGHPIVPAPAVLIPRGLRPAGGQHTAAPGSAWSAAGDAGRSPVDGRTETPGLHGIRTDLTQEPGGLDTPEAGDQQALESAVPRHPDGVPERFPDPFGAWSRLQNDGGSEMPGRSNNCADCSRSFLETWHGNPQVSAPRTLDVDEHGNPDPWSHEDDANTHQVRWSGAPHRYAGPGDDPGTAARIEHDLLRSGHGAAAIVQVDWSEGGGHAFNAVNHDGTVVWVDSQSGDVSHEPLHLAHAAHVWHLPMDPEGRPLRPAQQPETTDGPDDTVAEPVEPAAEPAAERADVRPADRETDAQHDSPRGDTTRRSRQPGDDDPAAPAR